MHRKAFALRELTCLTALTGVSLCALIPVGAHAAGQSRLQVCTSRLKTIGKTQAMFALDNADGLASLRSTQGQPRTYRTLGTRFYSNTSTGMIQSVVDQAIDVIQYRGNRSDFGVIYAGWIAPYFFNHLALADYIGEPLPSNLWACPEDSYLLAWQSDPLHFWQLGVPVPFGMGGESIPLNRRWPYVSSFVSGTCTWSADRPNATYSAHFQDPFTVQGLGPVGNGIGARTVAEIAFPSRKAYMWDRGARHFGQAGRRGLYWGYPDAKQPVLYFDGVVRTTRTGSTNPGWNYWDMNGGGSFQYQADFGGFTQQWHPGRPEGDGNGFARFDAAYFAATREGLHGADLR